MYQFKNKANIEIGLPAAFYGAVVIPIGDSVEVSDDHCCELMASLYTKDAINNGTLVVKRIKDDPKPKKSKRGVKLEKQKGGLWKVYVNGHLVTDTPVSKDEAARIAADY